MYYGAEMIYYVLKSNWDDYLTKYIELNIKFFG